jgi:hypothetical protein
VQLVGELEQVELLGQRAVLVGEEGEVGADSGAEGAVDVRLVDGHHGDAPVLPLDLVLERDEVPDAHLLLGAPPSAHEGEDDGLVRRDPAQHELAARVLGEFDVREVVAADEIRSHRFLLTWPASQGPSRRRAVVSASAKANEASSPWIPSPCPQRIWPGVRPRAMSRRDVGGTRRRNG